MIDTPVTPARPVIRALGRLLDRPPLSRWQALTHLHDRFIITHRLRRALSYRPNLTNPRTYNEKLAWRMLNDRNPLIARTTDKLQARSYVRDRVGADLLVPVLGTYRRAADIVWAALPNQFVLKANHGCDMNLVVWDKNSINEREVRRRADDWLKFNFYWESREWGYRDIQRRLYIEELLVGPDGRVPSDYKFIVFHGRTAMIRVHLDRFGDHRVNFYDPELNFLPVKQAYPTDPTFQLPPQVADMAKIAERLAAEFDYARVDLYLVAGQVRFGEITHYDGNATQQFEPAAFDAELGDLWRVPPSTS
ncbi:MAG: ATP-grasp fold amidoligase family protein [Nakamurella sp.]